MMTWPLRWLVLGVMLLTAATLRAQSEASAPALQIPQTGAYLGAYIDFGEHEDRVTLEAILAFEKMVGRRQAIIASSSWWGEQTFPRANVELIARHGSVPLVFWSPWDRPYRERQGPDRFSLTTIVAGGHDAYIDRWADEARQYGRPMLVSWGLEPNGNWFPWCGPHYDPRGKDAAGKLVAVTRDAINIPPLPQGATAGPELFKQAYRHVVDRVRARGATNIQWVFHANNRSHPDEAWNGIAQYYPGSQYADWLAVSAYGRMFNYQEEWWPTFHELFDAAYRVLCDLDPGKPILVAEWGVGEFPKIGSKPAFIRQTLADLRDRYPRVKGAVYWHERWVNADGSHSNLRVNSSPESLEAYRQSIEDPHWLVAPQWSQETR
jgi:hypothetical protein